ncbi:MAG: hypothetical protein U9N45_01540 [Gemmatimonadota bacterium]|nr:hypothetical protein [Gemmatimonadota bacterium]
MGENTGFNTWKSPGELYQANEFKRKRELKPALKVILGFLVPGLTQYLDGHWRSYGYFAIEGASIAGLVYVNSKGSSNKDRYINMARAARDNFAYPGLRNNPDEVPDPSLPGYGEYYEDLLKWPSSGDFDNDPSVAGVQPETDQTTYNGHQWKIAQINNYTHSSGGMPTPANEVEVERAIQSYQQAVYPLEYNWDWTGMDRDNEEYHRLFDKSEDGFRRRSTFATILIANHLVSGMDALVMSKINRTRYFESANIEMHLELKQPAWAPTRIDVYPAVTFSHSF